MLSVVELRVGISLRVVPHAVQDVVRLHAVLFTCPEGSVPARFVRAQTGKAWARANRPPLFALALVVGGAGIFDVSSCFH